MRTTLTLDDDVAARRDQEQRSRKVPFKPLVNEVLRAGLRASDCRGRRGRRLSGS